MKYDEKRKRLNAVFKQIEKDIHEGVFHKVVILHDKDKLVFVSELADSSVNLGVRCWFNGEDYWTGLWRLNETIKKELDANGVEIPFPQLDVHVKEK